MKPTGLTCAALAATLAAAAAGCGLGAGKPTGPVTLTVTDRFGSRTVGKVVSADAPGAETAMRQLQRNHRTRTSYEGRFVDSIDGLGSGLEGGRQVDWFLFVNGIEAPVGAAETALRAGDSVWWDRRDWGMATHVAAVVGQWPQPFVSGIGGKRLPVRIICPPGGDSACAKVESILGRVGVSPARGIPGVTGKGSGLRVVVGDWDSVRNDPAASSLIKGPGVSGVYVTPTSNGNAFELLDPLGRTAASFGVGSGLVAATGEVGSPPTWIITGLGPAGLGRAIGALNRSSLVNRYAVVVDPRGSVHSAPEVGR